MKYGPSKQYEPTPAPGGGGPAPLTTELFMKELTNIKDALQKNFDKKAEEQTKNWEDKLDAANDTIKELQDKMKVGEVTVAELTELKHKFDVQAEAFDLMQLAIKNRSMTSKGGRQGDQEDMSLKGQIVKGLLAKKDEITSEKIIGKSGKEAIQLKAVGDMTIQGNVSTGNAPITYRPGIVPTPFDQIHMRDLVSVVPSETDSYTFFRHQIGEGSIEFQKYESVQKDQFDEDLIETTINLKYLAGWMRISKAMLRNFTALQAYITKWLPEKYYRREDTKAYQVLIAGATGVPNGDIGGGMIRQIIRTIGAQKKARYNVNGVVVDGAVWANILTFTASGSGEFTMPIGVVTISPNGTLMICGIPVYVASWVGGDEAIVGDWRYFEIIQSEAMSLGFFEQDGTNVRENKITVRIEASVGFALLDPAAFAVVPLESVS